MKTRIIIWTLLLLMPLLLISQEFSWITLDPEFPEYYRIKDIRALNPNQVWVIAKDLSGNNLPTMYSITKDGGNTWQTGTIAGTEGLSPAMIWGFESIPLAYTLLYKSDENSTSLPGIYYTNDYGLNWTRKEGAFDDAASFPDIIHFWNEGAWGVAIGDPINGEFEIYTIHEYGDSIVRVASENIPDPLPGENVLVRAYDVAGNTIWFSTTRARVYRSDDFGLNWIAYSTLFDNTSRILVTDPDVVYLQTIPNWETTQLARTTDAAYSWQEINFNGRLLNSDLKKIPNKDVFVSSGGFLNTGFSYSCDQGKNWHSMNHTDRLFVMDWYDNMNGWIGGEILTSNKGIKPFIYKYDGPGIGSYYASTLKFDFGEVAIDRVVAFNLTLTNNSAESVDITDIISSSAEFFTNISSFTIEPDGGQYNVIVCFKPENLEFFEGYLTVFSNHTDMPELTIALSGTGVEQTEPFIFNPDYIYEELSSGEKRPLTLNFTNNSQHAFGWKAEAIYSLPLQSLGWNYGSTPLDGDDGILDGAPDQAMFFKDFEINNDFNQAILRLGYDDGIRVWVNGVMIFDDKYAAHEVNYWDAELDITQWLIQGINRITTVVFNGIFEGGGSGGFDCELEIDEQYPIKRGDLNYGEPEAMWYYYGETGQLLVPPTDINGNNWWEKEYCNYHWLLLNQYQGEADIFQNLGWNYSSTPISLNTNMLNSPPDNAHFIKDIEIDDFDESVLNLSFDDGCRVWINGVLEFDFHDEVHGTNYWDRSVDVSDILQPGRNRIAVEVYNGIYGGGAYGGFDCQLLIDNVEIIKRGDENFNEPEAMWFMYGESGKVLTPPKDASGFEWYQKDYGLTVNPSDIIVEGVMQEYETNQLMVLFNTTGLTPGFYSAVIRFTNTGTMETDEVPVYIDVTSTPKMVIEPIELNYEDYFIGIPETQKVKISNLGNEYLEIYDIFSPNDGISISYDEDMIEPGNSIYLEITIDTYELGTLNSFVLIESNDPLMGYQFIRISAEVSNAPDIEIPNVDYMFAQLKSGQTEIQYIPIFNWGDDPSQLKFSIPQAFRTKEIKNPDAKNIPDIELKNNQQSINQKSMHNDKDKDNITSLTGNHICAKPNHDRSERNGNDVIIFSDDMENGINGWSIENYMETETQWHLVNYFSNSPDHAWWCGNELTGTYLNGNRVAEAIISPPILLPPWGNLIILEFNEFFEVEENYDQLFVDISTNGGENWWRIRDNTSGWSEDWISSAFDISDFAGNEIVIRFLFDSGDDVANDFMGWFIDDVQVYSPAFPFLSISPSEATLFAGEDEQMTVTFDASGYEPGFYVGYFLILSNDPDEPVYYLPAHMEVIEYIILPIIEVTDVNVYQGFEICYEATKTILVAGEGTYFAAEPNSVVHFIAGENIIFREGTHLQSECYVHAYIDLEGDFCNNKRSIVAERENTVNDKVTSTPVFPESLFRIYPNPTTGDFTLEMLQVEEASMILVEIYTMQGNLIFSKEMPAQKQYKLSLTNRQSGFYLVRIRSNEEFGISKIIKE